MGEDVRGEGKGERVPKGKRRGRECSWGGEEKSTHWEGKGRGVERGIRKK